jgi:YD repeat-containing protein
MVMGEARYDQLGRTRALIRDGVRTEFVYDKFDRLRERQGGCQAEGEDSPPPASAKARNVADWSAATIRGLPGP